MAEAVEKEPTDEELQSAFMDDSEGVAAIRDEVEEEDPEKAKDEGEADKGKAEDKEEEKKEEDKPEEKKRVEPIVTEKEETPGTEPSANERRLRQLEGRQGEYKAKLGEQAAKIIQLEEAAVKTAKVDAETARAQLKEVVDAEFAVLREDWPEITDATVKLEERINARVDDALAGQKTGITREELETSIARERLVAPIYAEHPYDWETLVKSEEFLTWKDKEHITDEEYYSPVPKDVIFMLDKYQKRGETPIVEEDVDRISQQERLKDAIPATTTSTTRRDTAPTVDDAFKDGFEN